MSPEKLRMIEERADAMREEIDRAKAEFRKIQEAERQLAAQKNAFLAPSNSVNLVKLIVENPGLINELELLTEQKDKLAAISERLSNLPEGTTALEKSEIFQKRIEIIQKVSEVLLDSQISELGRNCFEQNCLLAILTEKTIVASHIGISTAQREALLKKSSELAIEFRQAIRSHKEKSCEIFRETLTQEQLEKLVGLYGAKTLDQNYSYMTPLQFFRSICIDLPVNEQSIFNHIQFWSKLAKKSKVDAGLIR